MSFRSIARNISNGWGSFHDAENRDGGILNLVEGDEGDVGDETLLCNPLPSCVEESGSKSGGGLKGGVGLRRSCRKMALGAVWSASRCKKPVEGSLIGKHGSSLTRCLGMGCDVVDLKPRSTRNWIIGALFTISD